MKRLVSIIIIVFLFLSCKDENIEDETNPYTDGIYPFEVSGISYIRTYKNGNDFFPTLNLTWTNPSDKGFSRVHIELYRISYIDINSGSSSDGDSARTGKHFGREFTTRDHLSYSSIDSLNNDPFIKDAILNKNSFSYQIMFSGDDMFAIVKCMDKFGNISEGIRHDILAIYPFEVLNLSHTVDYSGEKPMMTITWDNPVDDKLYELYAKFYTEDDYFGGYDSFSPGVGGMAESGEARRSTFQLPVRPLVCVIIYCRDIYRISSKGVKHYLND